MRAQTLVEYGPARGLDDDGLFTPVIKAHSLEKVALHNYFVAVFSTAMKDKWPQRAYLGLYSGAGRARIEETDEIVETTAMSVFRLRDPFTKYIFVDSDPACIDALRRRIDALPVRHDVTLIQADVREALPEIVKAMPAFRPGHGLISFCFMDPFSAALDFQVIRNLGSAYKMDFLVLLMLGRDVRTNFKRYLEDPTDQRIAKLIDDPHWREDWAERRLPPSELVPFLLEKFDRAMTRISYRTARREDAHPIRVSGKKVFLYSLVFYSKHPLGAKIWQIARARTDTQTRLDIP